ncbi:unnamed protein product [Vicia faba]|uniref:Major facilitator superfamily (MFS) profile domain-containing protein n=1 Tax=Vicia faba TaxID=3906 RepID=A0AAV0YSN7_VICFA|nr:unnamed protein product [Vicia faba]
MSMEKETNGNGNGNSFLNKHACACVLAATIISAIFGYITGVMAGALLFIKEELGITDMQVQLLAGILNVCALPACMVAGRTSDYIGRRYTIILSAIIFFLGSILMGYGPNFPILMIGRCIAGFGVGFALIITPVYSAEISSPSYRGFLTSLPDVSINAGFLFAIVESSKLGEEPLWAIVFIVVVMYVLVAFVAIGIGPVTWVYSSEIFPLRLRAQGLGVCVAVNRVTNVAVVTSFISIYKTITLGGTFFMLVGINALAWWFYYSFLPETKGRSLEDMETIFGKDSKCEVQMKFGSNNA